jgi:hypothetical protein
MRCPACLGRRSLTTWTIPLIPRCRQHGLYWSPGSAAIFFACLGIALALASDMLIGVVRAAALAPPAGPGRCPGPGGSDAAGRTRRARLVAAAPGPGPGLHPGRVPRLGGGGVPGRRQAPGPGPACSPHPAGVAEKATKTARFLTLVTERHGSLAQIPLDRVAGYRRGPGPSGRPERRFGPRGLLHGNPSWSFLYRKVISAQNAGDSDSATTHIDSSLRAACRPCRHRRLRHPGKSQAPTAAGATVSIPAPARA